MTVRHLEPAAPPSSLSYSACGKINLTLRVVGERQDGFHELHSIVAGVDWCDALTIRRTDQPGIALECSDQALTGSDNLVVRACRLLADRSGIDPALRINLVKRVPVGGGMGGGSSDAAAALHLCNRLWQLGLDDAELAAIGAEIGSDVPLFFSLPAAWMTGRGEIVRPVTLRWSGWVLLAVVDSPVSTPAVYSALQPAEFSPVPRDVDAILNIDHAEELESHLCNDLETAVFRVAPRVGQVASAINKARFGPVRVSGAGSTLYRLFDESEAAHDVARNIEKLDLGVRCVVAAVPTTGNMD